MEDATPIGTVFLLRDIQPYFDNGFAILPEYADNDYA